MAILRFVHADVLTIMAKAHPQSVRTHKSERDEVSAV